jgi:hypothetical protein
MVLDLSRVGLAQFDDERRAVLDPFASFLAASKVMFNGIYCMYS